MSNDSYINDFVVSTDDESSCTSDFSQHRVRGCFNKQPLDHAEYIAKTFLKRRAVKKVLHTNEIACIIYVQSALSEYLFWPKHNALQNKLNLNGIRAVSLNACENGMLRAIEYATNFTKCNVDKSVLIVSSDSYNAMRKNENINVSSEYVDASCALLISSRRIGYKVLNIIEKRLRKRDGYYCYPTKSFEDIIASESGVLEKFEFPLPVYLDESMIQSLISLTKYDFSSVNIAKTLCVGQKHYGTSSAIVDLDILVGFGNSYPGFISSCDTDFYAIGILIKKGV